MFFYFLGMFMSGRCNQVQYYCSNCHLNILTIGAVHAFKLEVQCWACSRTGSVLSLGEEEAQDPTPLVARPCRTHATPFAQRPRRARGHMYRRVGAKLVLSKPAPASTLLGVLLLRGTIVNRTYGTNKNLYVYSFSRTIFGPVYYGPPK